MDTYERTRLRWCDVHEATYTLDKPCHVCEAERETDRRAEARRGIPDVFWRAFADDDQAPSAGAA